MGIGFKASLPILGTVSGQYVPKADAIENADKAASGTGNANESKGSGTEIVIKTALGEIPFIGDTLGGNTLTIGYAEEEMHKLTNTTDRFEATVALTGSIGALSYGYQVEHIDAGQTAA